MSWLRLDDQYPEHPKLACIPVAARWAHVRCMAYCARHLTDGFIPEEVAREYAGDHLPALTKKPRIGEPLLVACDGGYEVHDYLDYNPTREKVQAEKKRNAERVARHRNADGNGGSNGVTDTISNNAPSPSPDPSLKTFPRTPKKTKPLSVEIDGNVLGYFEGKVGRDATDDEVRSLRSLCKRYSADVVNLAIGQAVMQEGDPTNFALITTIARGEVA